MNFIYKTTDTIFDSIKPYIKNKSEDDLEIAKYGLNLFLMELYKLPIFLGLAYFLGMLKYSILSYLLFGFIRGKAHGIHMKNGKLCLFYSCISFFSLIYISRLLSLTISIKLCISTFILYILYKYAPADTEQRPLLNALTRKKKKISSILVGIIYIILSLVCTTQTISNIFLFVMLLECIAIHPITYKIFDRRYKNYEDFE
ncbi:accessory gene regulator B family protein [Tepidibacter hydrothermalis]|uniref:Accessory gene regulator B family protein n=1 Tax=Tepidibacter hydrothermalis TaxID=3036126 RepID=A0ABY8EGF7_9FIRM|nr:accessory gene regulator B family protein [Tepidibacter hydrothermalis]WFD09945.1 accessory gene regulator B family protein [Tepidibacter hydrothermalis]